MPSPSGELPRIGHSQTERQGIAILSELVHRDQDALGLGCLFREVTMLDFGLDGQIEIVDTSEDGTRVATGKLLSVQVKSGPSFFKSSEADCWVAHVPARTVAYWRSHSLPVLLVLVDAESRTCYWTRGDAEHQLVGETYRVLVPKRNILNARDLTTIRGLAESVSTTQRRLGYLEADLQLMRAALQGRGVVMDVLFWINKSSGRCDYSLGLRDWNEDHDPRFMQVVAEGSTFSSGDIMAMAAVVVPWADPEVDSEFEDAIQDDLYDEYLAEHGTWDSEDGRCYDSVGIFDRWLEERRDQDNSLLAYEADGEFERSRLALKPNELGRSFPAVFGYLSVGE